MNTLNDNQITTNEDNDKLLPPLLNSYNRKITVIMKDLQEMAKKYIIRRSCRRRFLIQIW